MLRQKFSRHLFSLSILEKFPVDNPFSTWYLKPVKPILLFDLDGTLTDPKLGICRCIQYALEKAGASAPSLDELEWCIGPPLSESFARLVPGSNQEEIKQFIAFYRERFATIGLFENEIYPEIRELLLDLHREKKIFMATSKPHFYARQIARHFQIEGFFQEIYGSEMDGTRADKGELLKYLLEKEGIAAELCVMIGDRKHDVAGAAKVKISTLGVTWGYGSSEELLTAGAVKVISSVKELREHLLLKEP